jgi:hypothetical protein
LSLFAFGLVKTIDVVRKHRRAINFSMTLIRVTVQSFTAPAEQLAELVAAGLPEKLVT